MNTQQLRSIVDQIVDHTVLLRTRETVDPETLAHLHEYAVVYSELVRDFHRRLEVCRELLRQSQPKDARKLAQEEPDLRDTLQILGSRDLSAWVRVCEDLSLAVPQAIDDDASMVLEDVYQSKQAIDQLLMHQRRLVFSRAGLRDRLKILRRLSVLDSKDPQWRRDVEDCERARLEEMADDIERATQAGDLKELRAIRRELLSDEWTRNPSRKLTAEVENRITPLLHKEAKKQCKKLASRVEEAYKRKDEPAVRQGLGAIQAICQSTNLPNSDLSPASLAEAHQWCDELQARRTAEQQWQQQCMDLRRAIEERQDRSIVDEGIRRLQAHRRDVPKDIVVSVNLYLQSWDRRQRVMRRLRVVVVVAAVLAVGGGSAYFVSHTRQKRAVNTCGDQVKAAMDRKQWSRVEQMFEVLRTDSPKLWRSDRIQALYTTYRNEGQARRERWRKARGEVEAAGLDYPNMDALKTMIRLAATEEEKRVTSKWRDGIARRQDTMGEQAREARKVQQQRFQQREREVQDAINALPTAETEDVKAFENALARCRSAWEEARGVRGPKHAENLTPAQTRALEKLEREINAKEEVFAGIARRRRDIASRLENLSRSARILPSSANVVDQFEASLTAFVTKYPDDPRTTGLRRAITRLPHVKAVIAWEALLSGWKSGPVPLQEPGQAAVRAKKLADYVKAHPRSPLRKTVDALAQYYQAARSAFPPGETKMTGMSDLDAALNRGYLVGLKILRTKDGETYYYVKADPHRINNVLVSYTLWTIVDADGNRKKRSIGVGQFAKGSGIGIDAPVATLCASLRREDLRQFKASNWATFYLRIASKIRLHKDVNSVARGQLLLVTLQLAARVSPLVAEDLRLRTQELEKTGLSDVNWLTASKDEDAAVAEIKVNHVLKRMVALDGYVKRIRSAAESLRTAPRYSPLALVLDTSKPIPVPSYVTGACVLAGGKMPRMQKLDIVTVNKNRFVKPGYPLAVGVIVFGSR